MTDLADRLSSLSHGKRLLLQKMLGVRGIPRAGEGPLPLSLEQRRLWFLEGMGSGPGVHTIPIAMELEGQLRPDALEGALRSLVARHDALRTTFAAGAGGEPVQRLHDAPRYGWEVADLSALAPAARDAALAQRTRHFLATRFDLERGPLLRALLLRLAPERHQLLIALHHLVGDGWSTGVLRRELGELYSAVVEARDPRLPPLETRFRDFAVWQRTVLRGAATAADEAWWREELAGAPQVLELPGDRPRPPLPSFAGSKAVCQLPDELLAAVTALARDEGTTAAAVLAAAWAEVLRRHAGVEELLLGTVDANRWAAGVEGVVGFFANTLALRFRACPGASVRQAVRQSHAVLRGAREHARLPFDRVVELAGVRRDPARAPLLQALLVLSDGAAEAPRMSGLQCRNLAIDSGAAAFDLSLLLEEHEGTLRAELQLADDLFDPASGTRLLAHWQTLLEGCTRSPDRPLEALPLASAAALGAALELGCGPELPLADTTLHQAFEARARLHPDGIAVRCGSHAVSFGELNARADAIATRLLARHAALETRVGVCLQRTAALPAALLGVMKAGAAWVPLDPAHPPQRIAAVLRAAGARMVLYDAASAPALAGVPGLPRLLLDPADDAPGGPAAGAAAGVGPRSLAYVIATSGSTGEPKAVEVEHRSALAMLEWAAAEFTPGQRAALLAATAVTFDAAVLELLLPLCYGGTALLVDSPLAPLPDGCAPRAGFLVPSVAAELVAEGRMPPLEKVLVGGEPLHPALVESLYAAGVGEVVNIYGPTEDTTLSTWGTVPRGAARAPLGRPLPNGRVRVLDRWLRPQPVGVQGDLWLGGAGVARGYAGRPRLTAQRFVPDPWGAPGERMYASGDRGRWGADGQLEYLGRNDAQLKVRGVRVEPGEVEAALASHPAVAAAAVDVRPPGPGGALHAWLVAAPDEARPTPAELRQHLRARVPQALVPSAFGWTGALPRTSSGKLDRRALPDLPEARAARVAAAPRSPTEARLAPLWAEVLGMERVGVDDDFFDLGGQSILGARLAARVREQLGEELPLATLVRAPTIARLAALLDGAAESWRPPLVPLRARGSAPALFLGPPGGGHVVCYHPLAGILPDTRPVLGLQARGIDDGEAPHESVAALAAWFISAVRAAQPEGPYHLGGWSFGGVVAWEMARQLEAAGARVGVLALLDTGVPRPREHTGDAVTHGRVLQRIIADLAGWALASELRVERIAALPPRAQVEEALRQLGSPRALPRSRVEEILALTRVRLANLGALTAYRPAAYGGRLTYFRTQAAERSLPRDGALEFWSGLARGGTTLVPVGGSHGSILKPPFVEQVASGLVQALEEWG